jgi:hypothetical protein
MSGLRVSNMLATMLVGVAILTGALGFHRTAEIVLSAAVFLIIRSIETLRASNNRPEN